MSLASLCTHTGTIESRSKTIDGIGGVSSGGWSAITVISGSLQPLTGDRIETLGKMNITGTHVFYSPTQITATNGSRITISGAKYEVVYSEDQAGRGRVFAIYLRGMSG